MNLAHIIKRPIITEKSMKLAKAGMYTFEVVPEVNKGQIRAAVSKFFKVDVTEVKTMNVRGLRKRKPRGKKGYYWTKSWKKAIVGLAKGQSIDLFEEDTKEDKKNKKTASGKSSTEGKATGSKKKKGLVEKVSKLKEKVAERDFKEKKNSGDK